MEDMNIVEEWRPVVEYEGRYEVSSFGRVRSIIHGSKILKTRLSLYGYQFVIFSLGSRKSRKPISVHALVMQAFVGERPNGLVINHKDSCKTNNHIENLEYCTAQENVRHSVLTGRRDGVQAGSNNNSAKLKESDIPIIRRLLASGQSQKAVAKQFGVAQTTICDIGRHRAWVHVKQTEIDPPNKETGRDKLAIGRIASEIIDRVDSEFTAHQIGAAVGQKIGRSLLPLEYACLLTYIHNRANGKRGIDFVERVGNGNGRKRNTYRRIVPICLEEQQ